MTLEFFYNAISWALILSGSFFLFVGSLGMIRLGDFWARLHAASIIDSGGAGLILLGIMVQTGLSLVTVKMVIIILFLMITGPTATHAVANAAFVSGSRPVDLAEDDPQSGNEPPKAKTKPKKRTTKSAPAKRNKT